MEQRKTFLLRISPALWRELEAWAQEDLRSVNGQVEYLLRQAILKRRSTAAVPPAPQSPESNPTPETKSVHPHTGLEPPPPSSPPDGLELDRQD